MRSCAATTLTFGRGTELPVEVEGPAGGWQDLLLGPSVARSFPRASAPKPLVSRLNEAHRFISVELKKAFCC